VLLRAATPDDIEAITALHVDNWRRHYAGALSADYLATQAPANRLERWTTRLGGRATKDAATTVAVDDTGALVGFVYTVFDEDPVDGSLLDNLHVTHALARAGIGTQLIGASARAVVEHVGATTGLYLEVLAQNVNAQRFYDARGGTNIGARIWHAPDGNDVAVFRYAWPDPSGLLG
jgi:ribosomal protein S18 acetylase RimI-like enzyme